MSRFLTSRWLHFVLMLIMLVGLLAVRGYDFDWTRSLRYLAFDHYNRIKPRETTDLVAMVDINEESLQKVGQWAWPRNVMAEMVERLHTLGARAIVFDIVFAEPDRTSPDNYLKNIQNEQDRQRLKAAFEGLPDNDEVLAEAIREAGNVVTGFTRADHALEQFNKPRIAQPIGFKGDAKSISDTLYPMRAVTTNIPVVSQAAAGNGSFAVSPDIDGLIRLVPLLFRYVGDDRQTKGIYPALAVEAVRVAHHARSLVRIREVPAEEGGAFHPPYSMKVGNFNVPLDVDGRLHVYFSEARPETYIPAWKVLDGEADPDDISGRIVFIGTSAEGLRDIRSTPIDLFIPGVEVHMNVAEQIMTGQFLLRPWFIAGMELLVIAIAGFTIISLAPFVGALFLSVFTLGVIFAIASISWYGFSEHLILIDPVYPGISLAVLYATSALLTYVRTEAERRQVRQAFGLYISPDFMKELTKDPDKLKLGGETRELTVMFTDIRSFTSLSEGLSPEELIQLMNDFLTPMSDLVMQNRGTIDKYMGDAMMAFWNAPLDVDNHPALACRTILGMNEALKPINDMLADRAAEKDEKPIVLQAGVGVNTGMASVGNMGSKQRFAYSALGDTVNLASRLEGQTKNYGLTNLLGEKTMRDAGDFAFLEVDLVQVKGKMKPVRVFTLVGDEAFAETDLFTNWKILHDQMIDDYRAQNFDQAWGRAESCRDLCPPEYHMLYDVYRARITEMIKNLPGPDWDGVYVATSK